jgi:hypothetical protein
MPMRGSMFNRYAVSGFALVFAACSADEPGSDPGPAFVYVEQSAAEPSVTRLVRAGADGRGREVLYDEAEAGTLTPAPAPNGQGILFGARSSLGSVTWHLVPSGGGAAVTLATPPGVTQPRWSPDGNQLGWYVADGGGSIGLASPGSSVFTATTPAGWTMTGRMSWSPLNTELVVERKLPGGDTDLYILTVAGATQPLSVGAHLDYAPGWSPDGGVVAFLRNDLSNATSGIYVVAGDGTGLRQVAVGRFFSEVYWSPDGTSVATARYAGPNGDFQLVTVDMSTGTVTPAFSPSILWDYYSNPWSPDGTVLFETDANPAARHGVFVSDGIGDRRQVTPDSVSATSPAWIPE